jgi:cytoskeletal protein RodZ
VDTETKRRIEDFFEGPELVDFLQLPVSELIERFEDEIEEAIDEIEELMQVREKRNASRGEEE